MTDVGPWKRSKRGGEHAVWIRGPFRIQRSVITSAELWVIVSLGAQYPGTSPMSLLDAKQYCDTQLVCEGMLPPPAFALEEYTRLLRLAWMNPLDQMARNWMHAFERLYAEELAPYLSRWHNAKVQVPEFLLREKDRGQS